MSKFPMKRLGPLVFALLVGLARLISYWAVELCLRTWQVSGRAADVVHSTVSFILFCSVGWYIWQFHARKAMQEAIEDQIRNGLQIVRYLEALEADPAKRSALHAVEVKFASLRQPADHGLAPPAGKA